MAARSTGMDGCFQPPRDPVGVQDWVGGPDLAAGVRWGMRRGWAVEVRSYASRIGCRDVSSVWGERERLRAAIARSRSRSNALLLLGHHPLGMASRPEPDNRMPRLSSRGIAANSTSRAARSRRRTFTSHQNSGAITDGPRSQTAPRVAPRARAQWTHHAHIHRVVGGGFASNRFWCESNPRQPPPDGNSDSGVLTEDQAQDALDRYTAVQGDRCS
jgi:hypothetical protein